MRFPGLIKRIWARIVRKETKIDQHISKPVIEIKSFEVKSLFLMKIILKLRLGTVYVIILMMNLSLWEAYCLWKKKKNNKICMYILNKFVLCIKNIK